MTQVDTASVAVSKTPNLGNVPNRGEKKVATPIMCADNLHLSGDMDMKKVTTPILLHMLRNEMRFSSSYGAASGPSAVSERPSIRVF